MTDGVTNVHTVAEEYDAYWQDHTIDRGKGWKQFQRWYWLMEPRTFPSGERPDPGHYASALKHVKRMVRGDGAKSASWTSLGPTAWTSSSYSPGLGRVNVLYEDPSDPAVLYAGTPAGGLWRSADSGATWNALYDDLASLGVSGVAVDPTDPDVIYVATGDGDGNDTYGLGVLRSTDGGTTWNSTGLDWQLTQVRTTRRLLMHPTDPQTLFCATSDGLWRTADGGTSWTQVAMGSFRDVAFKPGDPSVLYACTNEFHRSTDNGLTFSLVSTGLPSASDVNRMAIAVSPDDPDMVYVLCGRSDNSGYQGLYRSSTSGTTFSLRSNSPNLFGYDAFGADAGGQCWYDMDLAVDPTDAQLVYVGGINVWRSTNGGSSWNIRSHWTYPSPYGYTHADIHCLEFFGNRLYCGSDGGAFRTTNGGSQWDDISAGLDIMQIYRTGSSATIPGRMLAGAQDNGVNLLSNGSWTHVIGADGMECAVDPVDPDILYGEFQNGGIMRSLDGGQNFSNIGSGIPEDGPWVTPFGIDPNNPMVLFAGFKNMWRSADRGSNWTAISNWNQNNEVRCFAVAPSNSNVIYAERNDAFRRTATGGIPWTIINGLPQLAITSIAVHPLDPAVVYVSLSGYAQGDKVYVSSNSGLSWTNISDNLPNVPANSIVYQPGTAGGIYVGTDIGVFYRDSTLSTWQYFSDGLPKVMVTELEVNLNAGKLRASTYGRGLWESDLYTPSMLAPEAAFSTSATRICAGDAITFTDMSVDAAPGWDWQFPGGTPSSSSTASPSVTYPASGTYSVTLTMSNAFGTDVHTEPVVVTVAPHEITVSIVVDNYPSETSWSITEDGTNALLASGGPFPGAPNGSTVSSTECLEAGCYTFTVYDSYGDGICCGQGNGSYTVTSNSLGVIATGGQFTFEESTAFCVSGTVNVSESSTPRSNWTVLIVSDGLFRIEGEEQLRGPYTLRVVDATGRIVHLEQGSADVPTLHLDLRSLPHGSYAIVLENNALREVLRVVR